LARKKGAVSAWGGAFFTYALAKTGWAAWVGLLPVPVVVCMIRVGTSAHPTGHGAYPVFVRSDIRSGHRGWYDLAVCCDCRVGRAAL